LVTATTTETGTLVFTMHSENTPKVTVCVITYNQEKYIRRCLQSIVDQATEFDLEVIVGEDCSTDGTRAIVQEFAERYPGIVKPIYQEKNIRGGVYNFLTVHRAAQGQYVAHIDGDDYALPGKLQAQVDVLDSKLGCTAVWHRVDYFDDAGDFSSGNTADLSQFDSGKVNFDEAIRLGFIGVHSSLMYRRSAREAIQVDQEVLDLYFTWDLLSKGSGYILGEVLGRYRIAASGSLTVSASPQICRLAIKHAAHFLKKYPEQRKNFFIWAITNAIFDVKNGRWTVFDYLMFALKSISFVSPVEILSNLINTRKIQVRWSRRTTPEVPGN
jgi:glycosyltransferase involved in cell wall biosynthesis